MPWIFNLSLVGQACCDALRGSVGSWWDKQGKSKSGVEMCFGAILGNNLLWCKLRQHFGCAASHCGQPRTLSWDDHFQVCQGSRNEIRMFVSLLPVVYEGSVLSRSVQETRLVLKENYSDCLAKCSDIQRCQNWGCSGNIISTPSFINILGVLVLAGVELIFLIVASMGLSFGFVLETVLITQGCFSYCWAVLTQSQGLFCSSYRPASE